MVAVEMRGMIKQYPLTRAVDNVDFCLQQGEIHSLLGENGAGKSTLMKILYGMTKPDAGVITINGTPVEIKNPRQAIQLGIGMVHQHFMLTPVMSVTENIVVGSEPVKGIFFDKATAEKQVAAMIDQYGFNISATEKVSSLSVGEQQRVEILKALYRGADILILDEPTAVLTPQEVAELFTIMRELKKAGKSIVIITHKLRETMAVADTMSVLRDGKLVQASMPVKDTTEDEMARMMVGRDVDLKMVRRSETIGETAFEVRNLTLSGKHKNILSDINLTIHKGEILGIAGIEGNGQTELIEVLTGLRQPDSMELYKEGKRIGGNAKTFLELGIGHVPEDRMTRGLILPMSITENLILGYHKRAQFSRRGIFKKGEVQTFAEKAAGEYRVKAANVQEPCGALSGGNQQKVVVARVFSEDPDVIIIAQPTRGVDIGAMEYIHTRMLELRDQGKAILLISADLDEVWRLSDRLAVIYDGRIVAENHPEEVDEIKLGLLMTGAGGEKEGVVQ